jgi:hypothetical protein
MRRCRWCGRLVRQDQPAFTWYRNFNTSGGGWFPDEPSLGWTDPQILCPSCAESAHAWTSVHSGLFAEVADA